MPGESVEHAIKRERRQLKDARTMADLVIDTSHMRTASLRARLNAAFSELTEQQLLDVNVF